VRTHKIDSIEVSPEFVNSSTVNSAQLSPIGFLPKGKLKISFATIHEVDACSADVKVTSSRTSLTTDEILDSECRMSAIRNESLEDIDVALERELDIAVHYDKEVTPQNVTTIGGENFGDLFVQDVQRDVVHPKEFAPHNNYRKTFSREEYLGGSLVGDTHRDVYRIETVSSNNGGNVQARSTTKDIFNSNEDYRGSNKPDIRRENDPRLGNIPILKYINGGSHSRETFRDGLARDTQTQTVHPPRPRELYSPQNSSSGSFSDISDASYSNISVHLTTESAHLAFPGLDLNGTYFNTPNQYQMRCTSQSEERNRTVNANIAVKLTGCVDPAFSNIDVNGSHFTKHSNQQQMRCNQQQNSKPCDERIHIVHPRVDRLSFINPSNAQVHNISKTADRNYYYDLDRKEEQTNFTYSSSKSISQRDCEKAKDVKPKSSSNKLLMLMTQKSSAVPLDVLAQLRKN